MTENMIVKPESTYWIILDLGPGRTLNRKVKSEESFEEISHRYAGLVIDGEPLVFDESDTHTVVRPDRGTILVVMTESKFNAMQAEALRQQSPLLGMPMGMPPRGNRQ